MGLITELSYVVLSCLTLISWDLIDFYSILKRFEFLWTKQFLIYYSVRVFFAISIMEILFISNFINISNKYIIAFLTPLLFPIILQNLVIELGIGGEGTNIRDVFLRFRETVIEGLQSRLRIKKMKVQTKLLRSSLSTTDLKQQCRLLAPGSTEFERLEGYLSQKNEEEKREGYIKMLTKWGGIESAEALLIG